MANNYIYISPKKLEGFRELFDDDFVEKFKIQSTPKTEKQYQLEIEAYILSQGSIF